MKVSGFTFVRNAVKFDYPVVESLRSLLPLCDEVIVAMGDCTDGTAELIRSIGDRKLVIVETVWDESMRSDGRILAVQTDIALERCSGDWCVYLQADEVLHEADYAVIRNALEKANLEVSVEALLFPWHHFYGTYQWVGTGRQWYRREIRAFRNTGHVHSWGDAQGFRTRENGISRKLNARLIEASVYHYGWVKKPLAQQAKQSEFSGWWGRNPTAGEKKFDSTNTFDYSSCFAVAPFCGSHPRVMHERIAAAAEWNGLFNPGNLRPKPVRNRILDVIENLTGYRLGEYRNYQTVD